MNPYAYWLGHSKLEKRRTLEKISALFENHYRIEAGAERYGALFPDEEEEPLFKRWRPVAPIQLSAASPLEGARARLGAPSLSTDDTHMWATAQVAAAKKAPKTRAAERTPDERRFDELLSVALTRAKERGRGVVLVVRSGWRDDDPPPFSAAAVKLMKEEGFAVADRRASE